eukprot:3738578-Pyramimonas_sp.AAC.1
MKTPSGHLALKADEYGTAVEDKGSMSLTISANPQREDDPLLVEEDLIQSQPRGRMLRVIPMHS